jgi:hypothetical protein
MMSLESTAHDPVLRIGSSGALQPQRFGSKAKGRKRSGHQEGVINISCPTGAASRKKQTEAVLDLLLLGPFPR